MLGKKEARLLSYEKAACQKNNINHFPIFNFWGKDRENSYEKFKKLGEGAEFNKGL